MRFELKAISECTRGEIRIPGNVVVGVDAAARRARQSLSHHLAIWHQSSWSHAVPTGLHRPQPREVHSGSYSQPTWLAHHNCEIRGPRASAEYTSPGPGPGGRWPGWLVRGPSRHPRRVASPRQTLKPAGKTHVPRIGIAFPSRPTARLRPPQVRNAP